MVLALALSIWQPGHAQPSETSPKKMMMGGRMMERCQEMKDKKEKMMTETKAQDAELTAKVAEMNRAPADKKAGLVAAVVTRMVEQRAAMHEKMGRMQDEMMVHMMEHMQMGKESMAQCPMMKGMKGMDEKSAGVHKEHTDAQK